MIKNPLEQSKYIKNEFSKYVKSTFVLKDEKYDNDFKKELSESVLTRGPYLKLELPFEKACTINELIQTNKIAQSFSRVSDIDLNRRLYLHQYKALQRVQDGNNIVVTTGTGSGKTEAFLYPIFDDLLKKIECNGTVDGIQAILLYPMNALVNDQLERLRKHLSSIPEITFGFFTGDTPEKYINSNFSKCSREEFIKSHFDDEDIKPPENELLVREEIRKNPPNILITNFSMLEYLLVRPKDSTILNADTLQNWSFMVLDEVHTYRGTLATEISHLLKRLQAFAQKIPQFILTSATLGNSQEDKKKIIEFASKLTSVDYAEDDIIYAKRMTPSIYISKYAVDNGDYSKLVKLINDKTSLDTLLKKYNVDDLFDLLSQDRNVHILYEILKETKTFDSVYEAMHEINRNISEQEFIDLINLVTLAKKEDNNLYDIKYHFFIRTLEGAFVSLSPNPKLKISNRQTIDDLWAFEIGVCKYCNSMYIIGKEYENHLFRSELDFDENYQNFDDLKVDFYLLKEHVCNSLNDEDLSNFEEHTVCSKCGYIYQNNHYGHSKCNCGEEYKVALLKVTEDISSTKTNLISCNICGKTSKKTGVINSFKLGKDQSTALIAQILLKSMDLFKKDAGAVATDPKNPFAPFTKKTEAKNNKQFLAFSDSRQQASFFALFFQENQNKFLRKALILNNLKSTMPIDSLIPMIERVIQDNSLFTDNSKEQISAKKNAYISVLLELFKSDGINSLEGLGLLSFEPDLKEVFKSLNEENVKNNLPKVNYSDLHDLFCIVVDIFRTVPAINYDQSGLDSVDRERFLEYRRFDNYVMLKVPPKTGDKSLKSLLPINPSGTNNLVKYLSKTLGLSKEEIEEYIDKIWSVLCHSKIISIDERGRGQIDFSKFIIYKKEGKKWYICEKCGNLTTHNINNCCVKGDCSGKLSKCDPDIVLKDNYYRNEYIGKKIEPIVVQEHTGQLNRKTAKDFQKGFKNKEINVLSSSTTFEMGVNIGSLDTVFMRNIPPTNSNYAQRAGRAGRSDESVAFIVTYANHNSHDQIYFNNPIPMIDGKINPPHFNLENNKITIRHIMAFLISQFYRKHNFSATLGFFVFGKIYEKFFEYLEKNKEELEKMLENAINQNSFSYYKNFRWLDEMSKTDSLIKELVLKVQDEIQNFETAEKLASEANQYKEAEGYKKQIEAIKNTDIVDGLARYNVIPGYGFPLDVVPLKIYDRNTKKVISELDLNRDLSLALSEYAPDSEVVVNKNKYTSRYIVIPQNGTLPKYYYYKCNNKNCGNIHIDGVKQASYKCTKCGHATNENNFIIPRFGFISDEKNKEDTTLKPKKTYASEVNYLGSIEPFSVDVEFNNILRIQQQSDDQLLIVNENPFFKCPICGYSVLNKAKADLDNIKEKHKTHIGYDCSNDRLDKITLGHIIVTDVIKIRIDLIMDYEVALSTMYAMLNGMTAYLQIDSNDINGIITNDMDGKYAFIFYDTTYGGAGNVKQMINKAELQKILEKSYDSVNVECCDENVSCTSCLRNYKNSRQHSLLKRKYARDTLKTILGIT